MPTTRICADGSAHSLTVKRRRIPAEVTARNSGDLRTDPSLQSLVGRYVAESRPGQNHISARGPTGYHAPAQCARNSHPLCGDAPYIPLGRLSRGGRCRGPKLPESFSARRHYSFEQLEQCWLSPGTGGRVCRRPSSSRLIHGFAYCGMHPPERLSRPDTAVLLSPGFRTATVLSANCCNFPASVRLYTVTASEFAASLPSEFTAREINLAVQKDPEHRRNIRSDRL
jgi:hypothetical protein